MTAGLPSFIKIRVFDVIFKSPQQISIDTFWFSLQKCMKCKHIATMFTKNTICRTQKCALWFEFVDFDNLCTFHAVSSQKSIPGNLKWNVQVNEMIKQNVCDFSRHCCMSNDFVNSRVDAFSVQNLNLHKWPTNFSDCLTCVIAVPMDLYSKDSARNDSATKKRHPPMIIFEKFKINIIKDNMT